MITGYRYNADRSRDQAQVVCEPRLGPIRRVNSSDQSLNFPRKAQGAQAEVLQRVGNSVELALGPTPPVAPIRYRSPGYVILLPIGSPI